MWIRNKKTGMKWQIDDQKMIERLLASVDYEIGDEVNYEEMSYNELKQLASKKGVNPYKLKKVDLIELLQGLEG